MRFPSFDFSRISTPSESIISWDDSLMLRHSLPSTRCLGQSIAQSAVISWEIVLQAWDLEPIDVLVKTHGIKWGAIFDQLGIFSNYPPWTVTWIISNMIQHIKIPGCFGILNNCMIIQILSGSANLVIPQVRYIKPDRNPILIMDIYIVHTIASFLDVEALGICK